MMRYVLALDFGASSGRAMLAGFDGSRITLQEVHRFANEPVSKDGRLYWNVPQLMEELEQGLQAGYAIAPYESIAIDTWGVDYGMLGADGTLLELPRHYRDGRTDGILQKAEQLLPAAELYRRTGTQVMEINTLFQLLCQRDSGGFDQCATILPMPDLFAYLLTGTISAERSIASTTQMLSAEPAHGIGNCWSFSTFPTGFCRKLWKAVRQKARFLRKYSSGWACRRFA